MKSLDTEIAALRAHANDVFGSPARAAEWFAHPSAFLDDRRPEACLETHDGIAAVRAEITRIAYGEY